MSATAGTLRAEVAPAGDRPRSRLKTRAGRRFVLAAVAATVLSAAFVGWMIGGFGGDTVTTAADDIGEALAALVGSLSCGYAASRTAGRLRVAWALLSASAFSWGAGQTVWTVYEVLDGIAVPFPSPADVGFLLAIPLAVAGVLAFPSAPSRLTTRSQALIDGSIVALSLVFVSWALGLGMVYARSSDRPLVQLLAAAYPASDTLIITVLLLTMRRASAQQRGSMLLILGGLAANAVSDSAFYYLNAAGTYPTSGYVLNAGWVIGYLMIALAPLWPAPFAEAATAEGPVDVWQMSVPWIALLGAAVVTTAFAVTGRGLDVFLTAIGGGLGVLLVVSMVLQHRDSVSMLENRERSDAQLVLRTEMLNEVMTHAPLGVARVGVDLRVIDANPRLGALVHEPARIMIGSLISDYLAPEEMARMLEMFKPLWNGHTDSVEGDSPVHRADGTDVWLHWSVTSVRRPNGHIEYFLAMFEDITAKHEAQEAAVANLAGLERLNQLKGEFVSMVSHEFRTALVGIQGFSEILRDEKLGFEEVSGLAKDINKDAQRLNKMIGEMLDLDRMEAGKIHLESRALDLNGIVAEAIERAKVSSDKHKFVTEIDRALPLVTGDPDRLVQVIANLLSNAVKYSPDGGEIRVATRSNGASVVLSVQDHGVGIPPEFVDRLFGRYERFESNRMSNVVGTGLGLAISRQIVELHGGRIWVDTAVGSGSTFYFSVPIRQATPVS